MRASVGLPRQESAEVSPNATAAHDLLAPHSSLCLPAHQLALAVLALGLHSDA
jgi:hypothetical protein